MHLVLSNMIIVDFDVAKIMFFSSCCTSWRHFFCFYSRNIEVVPDLDIKEETGTINLLDYLEKEGYNK